MMNKVKKLLILNLTLALGFGLVLWHVPSVCAQKQENEFTLEEITVTAEKQKADMQKTAISITAITGDDMRNKAMVQLDNALKDVAGIDVGGVLGGAVVFIRGVGSFVDTETNDPSTAITQDGVYAERAEQVMGTMLDVGRVEVLRGPQGTLYGRNAIGGTVNVISNSPSNKVEAIGNFTLGEYNLKQFEGVLNSPMSDKAAARIAFMRVIRDGYISNGANDANKLSFRARFSYKPTEKLSFLATYERYEDTDTSTFTVPVPGSAGHLPPDPHMWAPEFDYAAGWVLPMKHNAWTSDDWHTKTIDDMLFNTYTFQMDWDMGWGQLTLLPSYSQTNRTVGGDPVFDKAILPEFFNPVLRHLDGYMGSGELRLASPADSSFKWLIGYYMLNSDNRDSNQSTEINISANDKWNALTFNEPRGTKAIFGQTTYPVAERFRLTAGLRYGEDFNKKKYRFANGNITDTTNPYYNLATVTADGRHQYDSGIINYEEKFKKATYKGGIEYDVSKSSMLYVQTSAGYKAGGLNATVPPDRFNPESLVAYEIGGKNRFLNGRLQVNLEAFRYNYKNMQVTKSVKGISMISGQTETIRKVDNAGASTTQGGEIEADYLLTFNDKLRTTVSYLDAKYGKITINDDFGNPFELEGTQIANSPKWTGTLGYEHYWMLEDNAQISLSLDTKISSGYWATIEKFRAGSWQESYRRSNAYVSYRSSSGKWNTSVWMKNMENQAQTTYVFLFYRKVISDPRTMGVTISFKY
jgi:iron complex outermembrane recepter protein